jgi:ABC-type sugar transport system ATPase subunit
MSLGDRIVVLDGGRLQQCGPPRRVHDFPANRFVAEFVGDTPMNFLAGRLVGGGGRLLFDSGGGCLEAPTLMGRPAAKGVEQVVYGVRADALSVAAGEETGTELPNRLDTRVTSVELLGSAKNLILKLPNGAEMVARVDGSMEVSEGQRVSVSVDVARSHVFEPGERGMNLGLNGHGTAAGEN